MPPYHLSDLDRFAISAMTNTLCLELNEVNFKALDHYFALGKLPVLSKLVDRHGVAETTSENEYDHLEPWIQWVTVHTGLTYEQHGVYRLGDFVGSGHPQIWDALAAQGFKVGAISPMNAEHPARDCAFFIPDPWTPTRATAPKTAKRMYSAIRQAVNDNAQSKIDVSSGVSLLSGLAKYGQPKNAAKYAALSARAKSAPWAKALFLDLLLSDVFIRLTKAHEPNFASLFLNAAAHIQHHYMFSSAAYRGDQANPEWYIRANQDPVFEVYNLYDQIVGQIRDAFPDYRIMIATGLHQDPHPTLTFYWRLRNHEAFLRAIDIPFKAVEPRMSRDFLIRCGNEMEATKAEAMLNQTKCERGTALFEVDNRGSDLFVMSTYPNDIQNGLTFKVADRSRGPLKPHMAFVAIKNGRHNGIGYFLDTNTDSKVAKQTFPLTRLFDKVFSAVTHAI